MTLDIHWVTQRYANGVINAWHSYLPPVRGGILALGAFDGEDCVGVLVISRPKARAIDDGRTAEVTRVATNGYPNAASRCSGEPAASSVRRDSGGSSRTRARARRARRTRLQGGT